jgi:hypothetical protein
MTSRIVNVSGTADNAISKRYPFCGRPDSAANTAAGHVLRDSNMLRRLRGLVLRLVRRRAMAVAVGLALVVPAAWVEFSDRYGAWWVEGLALVGGATGLAILWTGVTGLAPDWVDHETRYHESTNHESANHESTKARKHEKLKS